LPTSLFGDSVFESVPPLDAEEEEGENEQAVDRKHEGEDDGHEEGEVGKQVDMMDWRRLTQRLSP